MGNMLPALTALLTMGSVFFFALLSLSVLSKALEKYQERYVAKSVNDLSDMFLFIDARALLALNICIMALMVTVGLLFFNRVIAAILAVAGFATPMLLVRYYRLRRIRQFNKQLVDALQSMASAFKSGLTFAQAVEGVGRDAEPPLSQEFGLLVKEIKLGVPLEEALVNMARRVGSDDLELMVTATNISRVLGGNLAEMFETLSTTIRERFRLEGKIQALTSQGKMQGWIVASLPLWIGLFLNYYRPDLMEPMFENAYGYILISAILLLESIGFLLIRRIVAIDV